MTAVGTTMNTNAKVFRNDHATEGTVLRSPVGDNPDELSTGPFCLVVSKVQEHTPCGIADAFSQVMIPYHVIDLKIFDSDKTIFVYDSTREYMSEVFPLVMNSKVMLRQEADSLSSANTAFLASGHFPLCLSEYSFRLSQKAGILDKLTVACNGESLQSHIDPHRLIARWQGNRLILDRKASVPLSDFTFESESFDISVNRTVHFEFDNPHALDFQSTGIGQMTTISPSWKGEAVKSIHRLETRISGFLSGPNSTEKSTKGFINASEHIMTSREIGKLKISHIPYLFKLARLVVIIKTDSLHSPSVPSFLKGGVIQRAGLGKLMFKGSRLLSVWIQAVFEGLTQTKNPSFDQLTLCDKNEPVADGISVL